MELPTRMHKVSGLMLLCERACFKGMHTRSSEVTGVQTCALPISITLASVSFCRNCERFLSPPTSWTLAKPESSELLAICLRKLKGLSKVRLTEAHFIWTEPHSKRLRVSMTIQKEVRGLLLLP